MGLFKRNKKEKAEWKQGLIPTTVELNEDHINLKTPTYADTIFYKDIMNIEVVVNIVNIKTNVRTFSLISSKIRGRNEKADELYNQIIIKMSEKK